MDPVLVLWVLFGLGGAAFYAYFAITGRSFRSWPLLQGGQRSMNRGYAAFLVLNFLFVVVAGWLFLG